MSESKEDQNSTAPDVEKNEKSPEKEKAEEVDEKAKESDKESGKSESEEEEEEEEMGLLDRPVEITGSRARKQVQRLELSFATPSKDKHEIPEGSGEKLGDCPRIELQIQKNTFTELKALHKILFNRPGSGNEIKKNIRKFCGFTFTKGSHEYERKKALLEKSTVSALKHVCEILDLERSGSKDELPPRILEFLLKPKASGKNVPSTKKRPAKGDKKKTQVKKSKVVPKKGKGKKSGSSAEDSESAAEDSAHGTSSDEKDSMSDEEKPKKKTKAAAAKAKESTAKGKKNDKSNERNKKEDKKSGSKGAKRKRENESDESSDDEPLAKKNKMPSDDDIKKLVKEILDSADLQEITMKKVIKQVADAYPDFDLSDKKDFIKTTVKSVIS